MKKWAFVSDFDGTISHKDFYSIIIEKHFSDGEKLIKDWQAGRMKNIDFLSKVFASIDQNEEQIIAEILQIPIDEHVPSFIQTVQDNGGDFYILSAGTDYYINHILKEYNIKNVKVLSNEGYYHNKNIHLNIDPEHRHYSEQYGIDKSKVVQELKEQYETIHYAGDSEPDSHPAVHSDLNFAKKELQDLLKEKNVPYIPIETFKDVEKELSRRGFIS